MRKLSEIILQPSGTIDFTKLPIDEEFEYDSMMVRIDSKEFSDRILDYVKSVGCQIISLKYPNLLHPVMVITKPVLDPPDKDRVMDFSQALIELKAGKKVQREGWNGKGMWLWLIETPGKVIDFYSKDEELLANYELLPWIGMKTADNKFVPWLCSQTDILANDWRIVE